VNPATRLLSLVVVALLITSRTGDPSVPPPGPSVITPTSIVPASPDMPTSRPTQPPPFTRSLNASSYVSRPCELLTSERQKALDMPPTDRCGPGDVVANCDWRSKEPKGTVLVHLYLVDSPFIAAYQEPDGRARWGTFEEVTIGPSPPWYEPSLASPTPDAMSSWDIRKAGNQASPQRSSRISAAEPSCPMIRLSRSASGQLAGQLRGAEGSRTLTGWNLNPVPLPFGLRPRARGRHCTA
jgi:hypothetical protein